MATERPILVAYDLTETELMGARLLQENTLKMIKTFYATDFMALNSLDPLSPQFTQQHAALTGTCTAWRTLIDGHEDTVKQLAVDHADR